MFKKILALGCLTLAASCTSKPTVTSEERNPAALGDKVLFTDYETQVLAELFSGDSPLNNYRHDLKVNIYANKGGKYLSETVKKSIQQALVATLGGDTPQQGLAKAVAGNLKSALMENFVKTLKVLKLINTAVQVDLTFVPRPNSPGSFVEELSSNQLVQTEETGRLSVKLAAAEQNTTALKIYNNSAVIPQDNKNFQYVGGMISLYAEVLDTTPSLKIPNPLRNGVKGFVRYRRYYKSSQEPLTDLQCEKFKFEGKKTAERIPQFFTVDLYKNANLKNLIPTEESVEIFPGRLSAGNEGRLGMLPNSTEKIGGAIATARYNIESRNLAGGPATVSLKKLVYSLKTKSLDVDASESELISYSADSEDGVGNKQMALANTHRTFLKNCGDKLTRQMGLNDLTQGSGL